MLSRPTGERKMPDPKTPETDSKQTEIKPAADPKPVGGVTPEPPKHNAKMSLDEVPANLKSYEVLAVSKKTVAVKLTLAAKIHDGTGMPHDVHRAVKGLWQGASSIEDGKLRTAIQVGRAWAIQQYRLDAPEDGTFGDPIEFNAEPTGDPKVILSGEKDAALQWKVVARLTRKQYGRLLKAAETDKLRVTTLDVQTSLF
jgi:hypothetical protein